MQFASAWVSSNLPFAGSHLPVCHPASNMEFAAPFGTAKKGKAAQVEEVQPMMADLTRVAHGKIRGGEGRGWCCWWRVTKHYFSLMKPVTHSPSLIL